MKASPGFEPDGTALRAVHTADLSSSEISAIRELLWAAFELDGEGFAEDDWDHALGGVHFLIEREGEIVAHASVVERELHIGDRPLATGYVEAVATAPRHQGKGYGSQLMQQVGSHIVGRFELGALGTGRHGFYERFGWLTWRGPSSVRTAADISPTPDDDGYIMVLPTPTSPPLDVTASISCERRSGDVW